MHGCWIYLKFVAFDDHLYLVMHLNFLSPYWAYNYLAGVSFATNARDFDKA